MTILNDKAPDFSLQGDDGNEDAEQRAGDERRLT